MANRKHLGWLTFVAVLWLSAGLYTSCSRQLAMPDTQPATPTPVPGTPTFTPTPTPIVFEDWDNGTSEGMWAGAYTPCDKAGNYLVNAWFPPGSAAISMCYDNTGGDPYSGTYCLRGDITWITASTQAEISPDSGYGAGYGYPVSIAASAPSSLSFWLKTNTAGIQFALYFQDTSGIGSGSAVNTAYYQNGTGANYLLSIPTAGTWTHFTVPLTAGTSIWSVNPTTMNWGAILDIGTVYQGPGTGTFPQTASVYMDDYTFNR